jgi:hypothetical protein
VVAGDRNHRGAHPGVADLVGWGIAIGRRSGRSRAGSLTTGLACGAFGALLIALRWCTDVTLLAVPNVSEGRDAAALAAIGVAGVDVRQTDGGRPPGAERVPVCERDDLAQHRQIAAHRVEDRRHRSAAVLRYEKDAVRARVRS